MIKGIFKISIQNTKLLEFNNILKSNNNLNIKSEKINLSVNRKDIDQKIEPKKIVKNTFYSFLSRMSVYVYAIITSFLLARQISPELWGFLILAISYITIVTIILSFIPPSLDFSLIYYIPNFQSLKKMRVLKTFLLKTFFLKAFIAFLGFIIFLILINFSVTLFSLNLESYITLLYILSPLIIINGLNSFLTYFKIGYGLFKYRFILNLIKYVANIIGYLLYFIFSEIVLIEFIAFINVISLLFPLIIDCFVFFYLLFKIESTEEKGVSFRESFKLVFKYGIYVSTQAVTAQLWDQSKIQAIGIFETPQWVTGFNIGKHYSEIPTIFSTAINYPVRISFTHLYSKGEKEQVSKISKIIVSYTIFIVLFITGILFLVTDFFLFVVYGEGYLVYSTLVKLIILSIGYGVLTSLFNTLLYATNKLKLVPFSALISFSIRMFFFFTGLIFFGLNGAIIGLIIGNMILLFLSFLFTIKIFKVKLNILKIFLQYLIFYISLGLSLLLGDLILNPINYRIYQSLNLLYLKHFPLLTLITFILIFLVLNLAFKIFTKKDAEYLELLFTKEIFTHKLIRKLSKTLKYILR